MSSRRSIVWLLFLLALAAGAHVLVTLRDGRMVSTLRRDVLVPNADGATLVEFVRTDAPSVVAVRSDRWRIVAPFAAAVDRGAILGLLDVLAFAPVSAVLTPAEMRRLGRTPADFGLENPRLRISVRQEMRESKIVFGDKTPAGDGVYATLPDFQGVCVVPTNAFAALDLSLDALRQKRLLAEGESETVAVDVRRPAGKFVRVRQTEAGAWRLTEPKDSPASASRVTDLVKALADARSLSFVWPTVGDPSAASASAPSVSLLAGYGLDSESATTVTLKGADGSSRFVTFGKSAGEGAVYALVQNGTAVVTVPSALRDRLSTEADSFADLRIFPNELASVATLSIADGDVIYLVARTPEGDWRLDTPVSAPADADAVRALLKDVLALRAADRDPHGLLVTVATNMQPVGVSRDALLVQNRLEDLRSKTILKLPSERMRRLTVTAADGRVESAVWDAANRTWLVGKPDGARMNGLALAGVLGALDPLMAKSVVRLRVAASETGNFGLEKPRFTIAIDPLAEGAIRRNVLIGSAAPGGGAYATVGSTDAVFVIPDDAVRALTASFATRTDASQSGSSAKRNEP